MIKLEDVIKSPRRLGDPKECIGMANKSVACRLPLPAIDFIHDNNIHIRLLMMAALEELGYKYEN